MYQSPADVEQELIKLQKQYELSRTDLFIFLANLLATGILSTHVLELSRMLKSQSYRYVIRRLRSSIKALESVGLLNVDSR